MNLPLPARAPARLTQTITAGSVGQGAVAAPLQADWLPASHPETPQKPCVRQIYRLSSGSLDRLGPVAESLPGQNIG